MFPIFRLCIVVGLPVESLIRSLNHDLPPFILFRGGVSLEMVRGCVSTYRRFLPNQRVQLTGSCSSGDLSGKIWVLLIEPSTDIVVRRLDGPEEIFTLP